MSYNENKLVQWLVQVDGSLSGFGNSRSASEHVFRGPTPVVDSFPCSNRPKLVLAGHSRAQLPGTDTLPYLRKTSIDLDHGGSSQGIVLYHAVDEWFYKLEPFVFLPSGKVRTHNF